MRCFLVFYSFLEVFIVLFIVLTVLGTLGHLWNGGTVKETPNMLFYAKITSAIILVPNLLFFCVTTVVSEGGAILSGVPETLTEPSINSESPPPLVQQEKSDIGGADTVGSDILESPETVVVSKNLGSVTSVGYFPSDIIDDYVITQSLDVYYIQNNKLIKLSPDGNEVTLFDGDSYYDEVNAYDIITSLNLSFEHYPDIYNQYLVDQKNNTSGTTLVYVDGIHLQDIAYDPVEDKVYLLTIYRVNDLLAYTQAYTTNYYTFDMINLWDVQQLTDSIFGVSGAYRGASYSPSYPRYLTSTDLSVYNGEVMFSMYHNYYDSYVYKLNVATGKTSQGYDNFTINNSYKNEQLYVGDTLYQFSFGTVSHYSISSERWESVNLKDSTSNSALCYATFQGKIYFMTSTGLYVFDEAGTNRLEAREVLAFTDLSLDDRVPFGTIECFSFDGTGNMVYADSKNGLLRKITLNEFIYS